MSINHFSEKIWTIDQFLTAQECQKLIDLSETIGYSEAEVSLTSGAKMMKNIRNNYRTLYKNEVLAAKYWNKLKEYCPETIEDSYAIGLNEQFRFYKYELNQRFKKHIDGRFRRNEQEGK